MDSGKTVGSLLGWILSCCWIILSLSGMVSSYSVTVDMPQIADMSAIGTSGFSCEGKVIGGYYADIASGCQMFHVCTLGQEGEIRDIKFLCLAGTVFDQETRVCERVDEVDCANSETFYNLNLDLYGQHGLILQTGRKVPSGEAGTFTDEQNLQQQSDTYYDYQDYEDDGLNQDAVTTTTIVTSTPGVNSTTHDLTTTTESATTTVHTTQEPITQDPTTTTTSPTTIQQQTETTRPFEFHSSTPTPEQQPVITKPESDHSFSEPVLLEFVPVSQVRPAASTTTRQPEERPASDIAEDEDVLRLLGQIEADVPRIPSFSKSAGSRNSVLVPRIRRDVTEPPKRNRTRRPGSRRPTGYSTTLPSVPIQSELASPIPVDNKGPFTCTGRITGGFYADISSGCSRFFICGVGKKNRVVTHTFSCGVGLLFDQATLTCQDIDKVDCSVSASFFYLNDPALRPPLEPEVKDTFQSLKMKSTEKS